jgi:2-polyprenyl-3-methyl-5-hydroxy-6-metoxy-1,4-benzoquinol methylase
MSITPKVRDRLLNTPVRLSNSFAMVTDSSGGYIAYSLAEPMRYTRTDADGCFLLTCFSPSDPITVKDAIQKAVNMARANGSGEDFGKFARLVGELIHNRILVPAGRGSDGPYSEVMASHYVRSRSVPSEVCECVIREASIRSDTSVLDLGSGTGSVAVQLAAISQDVTAMDISRPFLRAAKQLAEDAGVSVRFIRECGNKLLFHPCRYSVIVISQAFHWLDPMWAAKGIGNVLEPNGSVFFIETKAVLRSEHVFRRLLDFGCATAAVAKRCCLDQAHQYRCLFEAIASGPNRLVPAGSWLFREHKRFDFSFAVAYFFTEFLRAHMPAASDLWRSLELELERAPAESLFGEMYWYVLRFVPAHSLNDQHSRIRWNAVQRLHQTRPSIGR